MEKQSTRKFLKLIVALVALFLLGASALMLASCNKDEHQHSYTSSVTTPATCSNPGVETFTCSCGYAYTQIIPATGDHDWQVLQVYPNSCESDGYTVYECSVCHEQKQGDWTAKRDHKYEAVETVEATCTTDGYQIMQCSYCGDRYTDDQYSAEHKATGHKWIENTDAEDPASAEDKKLGWVTVSNADCLNANKLERTCARCGLVEEKSTVAALGHAVLEGDEYVAFKDVCKIDESLVDNENNAIYAFECDRENCPVEVVIDSRGTTAHYIAAVDHTYKASTDTEEGYIAATCTTPGKDLQVCEVCGDKVFTDTPALDHSYNTIRMDGKTDVVVCEEDTGLTRTAYLTQMKQILGVEKYAQMAGELAAKYKDGTAYSCFCTRCGELHEATGHEYVVAALEEGKYGLNDYEKDESGKPVDSGLTVAEMDCRYVQVCKNGCGTVLGKGQHGDIVAATCRAGGYCETCGEQVTAQLDHKYESVATILTYANSADKDQKALYDAYVKVSATETWMTPVTGSCDVAGTTVQVCTQCLLDAANGAEFTWNTASVNLDASNPVYNGSVVAVPASHDYEMHYYRLNATSLADEIVYEQTNCEFGFKVAYICKDCGNVYKNVPVGDDETTEVNEAENNKDLGHGYTDSNGFVLDTDGKTMTSIKVADVNALQAEDNKGTHSIYAIPDYAKTNGYVAPTCVSKAIIPFVCEKCGATFTMEANTADADDNAWNYATAAEDKIVSFGTGEGEDGAVNPANHAGTPYACGTHCDYHVGDVYCSKVTTDSLQDADASAHATVEVSYRFSTTVKYYTGYELKVADVPAAAITEGKIDFTNNGIALSDTTKVSKCVENSKYTMPKTVADSDIDAGDYLVLVAEDGTIYGLKQFTLYTEDGTNPGTAVSNTTTVNQNDVFFVRFDAEGAAATDAPVAAVNERSLELAFQGTPDAETNTLTVNVRDDIELNAATKLRDVVGAADAAVDYDIVVNLNGNTITQAAPNSFWAQANVTFVGGELEFTAEAGDNVNEATSFVLTYPGYTLTITDTKITVATGSAIFVQQPGNVSGYDGEQVGSTLVMNNATIEAAGAYGVATNATSAKGDTPEVDITITNSTITAGSKTVPGTALFINVPSDVLVEDSTLTASYQAVVVRGGTLNLVDSTLTLTEYTDTVITSENFAEEIGTFDSTVVANGFNGYVEGVEDAQIYRLAGLWAQGNGIPRGAIVVGNSNSTAYQYFSYVKLSGVTFNNGTMPKIVVGSHYGATAMGNATDGWNTMVTVDATGMGLGAEEITYCFNTVRETVSTVGFVKAN